jgi:hypothetical protein
MSTRQRVARADRSTAPAISGRRSPDDIVHFDQLPCMIDSEENPIVADPSSETRLDNSSALDISSNARPRIAALRRSPQLIRARLAGHRQRAALRNDG